MARHFHTAKWSCKINEDFNLNEVKEAFAYGSKILKIRNLKMYIYFFFYILEMLIKLLIKLFKGVNVKNAI